MPTTDTSVARQDLATHGYCLIPDALSPEQGDALRTRLVEQAAGEDAAGVAWHDAGGANQRVWMLLNKGQEFVDLALHPLALELMRHLLGPEILLSSITANIAGKGGLPMVLNADQGYVAPPWSVPMVANVMWMLDDFTEENGATRLVPGSHLEPGPVDHSRQRESVAGTGKAGTALVFDGRLLHGTGQNVTDQPRHGILTYYSRFFIRQQENFTLSLSPEVLESASDELKALVGFKVTGTLGGVEGPREATLVKRPDAPVGILRP